MVDEVGDSSRDASPRLVGALAGEGELHPSQERALEATGTQVLLRGPASFDLEALMDPTQVAAARADGAAQAAQDADAIADAWA